MPIVELTVDDLKEWMRMSDHTQQWVARECNIDVRTLRNWFAGGKIPKKQQVRLRELIKIDSEVLHPVTIILGHGDFLIAKKRAFAEGITFNEYCKRTLSNAINLYH